MSDTKTVPTVVVRLIDGTQHVRNLPMFGRHVPNYFSTPEVNYSQRLAPLDFDIPDKTEVATWQLDGYKGTDFMDLNDWIREFKNDPPAESIVITAAGQRLVVIQWADFKRVSSA